MTHHSEVRYGGYVLADNGSCAKSGPVMVKYFDPETGRPRKTKPAPRKAAKKRRTDRNQVSPYVLKPGFVPSHAVAVTFDGIAYPSMHEAAQRNGMSHNRLVKAKRDGLTELDGKPISFS